MREFTRPRVVVSRCLGFAECRWNGVSTPDDHVEALAPHVTYCPVCPEVRIGLGVPRDPIRIGRSGGEDRLVQLATGRDVTEEMTGFAKALLDELGEVDGVILKGRSPSCGIGDVKIYHTTGEDAQVADRGAGMFARHVLDRCPGLAIENEGRLNNFLLREHFLTKLFTRSDFRRVRAEGLSGRSTLGPLVDFHGRNKWLLMAASEEHMRRMGRVVANHEGRPTKEVYEAYDELLGLAMATPAGYKPTINVLMHALGYVSDGLTSEERQMFLDTIERYRSGRLPLSVPVALVKAWGVRFGVEPLLVQTFLHPYPEDLVEITDSGKGRGG